MKTFIKLTERRGRCKILFKVDLIATIEDLRTDPSCPEDFHYTVIHCGNDVVEVKETADEIMNMLSSN